MEFGEAWIKLNPDAAWVEYFTTHPSKLGAMALDMQRR